MATVSSIGGSTSGLDVNLTSVHSLGVHDLSRVEIYLEAGVLTVMSLIGTVHNLLILVAGIKKPKLQRGINILVLNMAAVDLVANAVVYPLYACAILRGGYPGGDWTCQIQSGLAVQDISLSVFTNFAIAFNRCAGTRNGKSCMLRATSTKVIRAGVIVSWLLVFTLQTMPMATGLVEMEYHFSYNACIPPSFDRLPLPMVIYFTGTHVMFYALLLGSIVCYVVVWKRVKGMAFNKRSDASRRRYVRTTKNVALIFVVFCVCWLPDSVHWMLDPGYDHSPVWVTRAGVILYFANSAINPFLFAWRFPAYRKVLRAMFIARAQRRSSIISSYFTERRLTCPDELTALPTRAITLTSPTESSTTREHISLSNL